MYVMLCFVMSRYVMLCCVMSRYDMLRYVMSCHVMLRYGTLRYVMFIISPPHLLFDWQPSSFAAGTVVVVWVVLFLFNPGTSTKKITKNTRRL